MGTVYSLIPFVYRKRPQVIYAYSSEEENRFTKKLFTHARLTLRRGIAGNITSVLFTFFFKVISRFIYVSYIHFAFNIFLVFLFFFLLYILQDFVQIFSLYIFFYISTIIFFNLFLFLFIYSIVVFLVFFKTFHIIIHSFCFVAFSN